MKKFETSPISLAAEVIRNWSLIRVLAFRDLQKAYRASYLGFVWLMVQPLAMLVVYGFVFGFVLQARFGGTGESELTYALNLFLGLIAYNVFAECLTRGPTILLENVNYVKRMIFPLEVLPVAVFLSALYKGLLSFAVWLVFFLIAEGKLELTIFALPLLLIPLCAFSLGVGWMLSSIGVYLRDLTQVVGVVATATLFLSAIFYPLSVIPEEYRAYLYLNPMTSIVEQLRMLAIHGRWPSVESYAVLTSLSLVFLWFSYWWFQKLRRGFADVV